MPSTSQSDSTLLSQTLAPILVRWKHGMVVRSDTPRVQQSRTTILELLNSAVDVDASSEIQAYTQNFGAPISIGPQDR